MRERERGGEVDSMYIYLFIYIHVRRTDILVPIPFIVHT